MLSFLCCMLCLWWKEKVMPFNIEFDYWAHSQGTQAPAFIKSGRGSSNFLKTTPEKTDDGISFKVRLSVELEPTQEKALNALILLLDPEQGSEAMDAIHLLLEDAFLGGMEFAQQLQKS